MIYKVLSLYYMHLFPPLMFLFWDEFKNRCSLAWGFVFVFKLLCSFTKKKTGSVFPAFCHTTFYHALITRCNVSRAGYIAQCITIGIHLILVKTMWSANGCLCLVEWKSRNITKLIVSPRDQSVIYEMRKTVSYEQMFPTFNPLRQWTSIAIHTFPILIWSFRHW